jgi:diguanylate cyclase (GGDEF)-like protein
LFGYETSDLIGKHPSDVTMPEDQEALAEQRKMRQAGKISTYESRLRRADGSAANVLITAVPREANGRYSGSIAVITDLTEQKRIEAELRNAKDALEQALAREQQLAQTDVLTGINNRRNLFKCAEREFNVALRYQRPLSVIMFDIDHFKAVNDTFGHAVGDQILKQVADIASVELRNADVIGRYGGEEFVVVLPMTNVQQACLVAERIRVGVEALRVPTEKGDAKVTLSIGIVEMTGDEQSDSIENLTRRADEAMYAAKQEGRNRIVTVTSEQKRKDAS